MAKDKKKVVIEDEEDDLEDLEDLEDLADEEEPEEDEDEDEDDDEDEPKKKKSSGKKKKAKKESDTVGSAELAEALGTDGKNLRVMLRDKKVKKSDNKRYEWDSVEAALEAMGFDDLDEAKEALAESRNKRLDALKERNAANKKTKTKASDDDDTEEEEDDTEEEIIVKKTKKKTKSKK